MVPSLEALLLAMPQGTLSRSRGVMTGRDERTQSFVWDASDAVLRVLCLWDGGLTRRVLEPGARLAVGRADDCDLVVPHGSVSRRHLVLHGGPPARVEDLGSTNGTRVDGRRIPSGGSFDLDTTCVVEFGSATLVLQSPWPQAPRPQSRRVERGGSIAHLQRLVGRVAISGLNVLLLGETGVGKDVMATLIHEQSKRRGALLGLNCAALAEALLESELFGHERGAFTGAVKMKPGLLESAGGGTVLLDEVGDMPLTTQAKLLRVIENRELLRVGGLEPRRIDVRFVSATHRDLAEMVGAGAFRKDLFYRLNGVTIRIPPLRERLDEIPALARTFVAEQCERLRRKPPVLSAGALARLASHPWTGNIRELRNVIERAVVLTDGARIEGEHLLFDDEPYDAGSGATRDERTQDADAASYDLRRDVDRYERARIVEALDRARGNQTKAAAMLGLTRRALITKLEAHGLPRPRRDKKADGEES